MLYKIMYLYFHTYSGLGMSQKLRLPFTYLLIHMNITNKMMKIPQKGIIFFQGF